MKALLLIVAVLGISLVSAVYDENSTMLPSVDTSDQYIFVFKENLGDMEKTGFLRMVKSFQDSDSSLKLLREYRIGNFHAFLVKGSAPSVAVTGNHPYIKYYTMDNVVHTMDADTLACNTVPTESWGLNRVSVKQLNLDGNYKYEFTGKGVNSYIIDTGVYIEHEDFEGRATWGKTFTGDGNDSDCNGHGTHVAGTVGGKKYGIAKEVNLIGVKVLNCFGSGSWSGVIGGIEWTAQEHQRTNVPSTANLSLGGFFNQAINDAIDGCVNAGVSVAVAAGNDRGDACRASPASSELAITVGSTQNDDKRSSFSAVGTCVDVFAPGTNIKSTWIKSPTDTNTISGTSMATPHVCGVASLILQDSPSLTPKQVKDRIVAEASSGLINLDCVSGVHSSCPQSPNKLLHITC